MLGVEYGLVLALQRFPRFDALDLSGYLPSTLRPPLQSQSPHHRRRIRRVGLAP